MPLQRPIVGGDGTGQNPSLPGNCTHVSAKLRVMNLFPCFEPGAWRSDSRLFPWRLRVFLLILGFFGKHLDSARGDDPTIPSWARDAVFYQLFPERFRNGDRSNDPSRESLEFPDIMPATWSVTPWTDDWYSRAPWEISMGTRFYDDGVFHRRCGGDLQGVMDKLDYLRDLGVTCIYFNPVFYARSLHKYDGGSFHHIDPHFGPDPAGDFQILAAETSNAATWRWTAADRLFLELVKAAHERGLRVIVDGVFNHSGRDFFAFQDILRRQRDSRYTDWYTVEAWDDPATPANEFRYKCWWGVDTLPEFANSPAGDDLHPGPKKYFWDITRRWMDPDSDGDPADGIDGWRLDVANEVPEGFWRDWNDLVRAINPQAYTVAEIWDDAAAYLARCRFSASMNYHAFAFPVKGGLIDQTLGGRELAEELRRRGDALGTDRWGAMQNLLDSHDTDRVASMIVNASRFRSGPDGSPPLSYRRPDRFDYDVGEHVSPRHDPTYQIRKPLPEERRLQRLVTLFQMTYLGAPMIYYGTEAGMWGGDDPDDRMPMVWPELDYLPQTHDPRSGQAAPASLVEFDHPLHDFYCRAIRTRHQHRSLRHGTIQFVAIEGTDQALGFLRSEAKEHLLVLLHWGPQPASITWAWPASSPFATAPPANAELLLRSGEATNDISMSLDTVDPRVTMEDVEAAVWKLSP